MKPIKKILVTTDLSTASEDAFPWANAIAGQLNASLTLLSVFDPRPPVYYGFEVAVVVKDVHQIRAHFEKSMQDLLTKHFMTSADTRIFESAFAWRGIVDVADADQFDLIVMASHGRAGVGQPGGTGRGPAARGHHRRA